MKYVVSQIDEGKNTSEIIHDVNVSKAIHWLQVARRDVSTETIINFFFFFLFGFSFTNIHDSRDSRGRGRVSI